ncbi:cell wall metabolism sensor histidine kinase WalK [Streptomyces sp. NBC_00620]|uniref:sensor histidine kinase n=1 Tax=unclassified Streptomyces TaxID=2593676 RepID=UPI0022534979|nr:HAMP domain-containing sensor histidine kinase [Streptomyces sp. NBC_00620]MCX4975967.1 HAMP domain-containing histidine kinase [Streptomyces sp. NBC_00620]WUC09894.1 HAMP domain-containing histidine kinase [Streptomyces sp. NBC_00564]
MRVPFRRLRPPTVKLPFRLPAFTHTIRFRLTVLYSGLLFVLTALVLGGTYLAVERSGEAHPVTKQFTASKYVDNVYVGEIEAVKVQEVEAAVNYETLANLRRFSLAVLGGLAVTSLAIGWVLSGRALRPVRSISRTAAEIQATDLSQRIRLDGPKDELRDLADTVDSMLDRLDEAFRAQRQLIDDASHELRSPLAIIRANLDAVLTAEESDEQERRAAARSVDRATTRMTRLVEDLLATARRSAPALADADVDLAAAATEACEEFASLAAERGLVLRRRLTTGLTVIGDHDALRRAVGNLLSNAVRLAPPGTRITVSAGRAESWLWISVRDEGPGILDDDQARVFDRFWRAKGNTGGRDRHAGLGLAIVRQIVESHAGQIRLFSRVGEGSTFVLWFPAPGADQANGGPPEDQPPELS